MALDATYTLDMKILSPLILIACGAIVAGAADEGVLSGNWQLHQSIAGNESDQSCTFTQKGNELTGTCNTTQGSVQITGKVEDKKVSWSYKSQYNGGPLTMKYQGALSASKITGSVNVEEYGVDGEFIATQSK